MSGIYHTEPPTQGKVLLKTTHGDIDIEIWPKETPLACRNFVQLCLEGYYDGLLVHRVIKDFMIQTGDPNGDGSGGTSIWGRPFKDEIHGRIKFNHRGQVAMANENKPNTNQSQFFITLGNCDWIDRKHTIFGKVTGNTIYNVTRMGEVEVGLNDKPIDLIKIIKAEVLWNPFDDIIPRVSVIKKDDVASTSQTEKGRGYDKSKKSKDGKPPVERKAVKDSKLLSFGDDETDDGPVINTATAAGIIKGKWGQTVGSDNSKQQSTKSSAKDDVKTASSSSLAVSATATTSLNEVIAAEDDGETEFEKRMMQSILQKRKMHESSRSAGSSSSGSSKAIRTTHHDSDDDDDEGNNNNGNNNRVNNSNTTTTTNNNTNITTITSILQDSENQSSSEKVTEKARQYQQLRNDLLRSKRAISVLTGADVIHQEKESIEKEVISVVEQRRQKYLKRKNEYGNRQEETMAKLLQYTNNIRQEKLVIQEKEKKIMKKCDDDDDNNTTLQKSILQQQQQVADKEVEEEGVEEQGVHVESYHGQILQKDNDDDDDDGKSWHVGKLKCRKHIDDKYRIGSDGRHVDDYEISTQLNH